MMGFGLGGLMAGGLLMIVFWVLVIGGGAWLVVTLVRHNATPLPTITSGQTSLAILQARYAKGEITKEQFDQMRHDLTAKP